MTISDFLLLFICVMVKIYQRKTEIILGPTIFQMINRKKAETSEQIL